MLATLLALALGFLLDQWLGDPPDWPHPVRALGWLVRRLEPLLRPWLPERLAGILLWLLVVGTAAGTVWALLLLCDWLHPALRLAAEVVLIYQGLAVRSLADETEAVQSAARAEDWTLARQRLSRIVGRDTDTLSPTEIHRACLETVGENTTDAVVAPLLYAALGGPVALWAFKAISTLDSMVGYRNERYRYFGWASARADDVANFIPARVTWLLMALAATVQGRGLSALRVGWRDGRKHPSPNSAWGEATLAGALGVCLGGTSSYQGQRSEKPLLGAEGRAATARDVAAGIRLMQGTAWLSLLFALLLRGGLISGSMPGGG